MNSNNYFVKLFPLFLLFSLGTIWGSSYSIVRYIELHGISFIEYTFLQTAGATALLSLYAKMRRHFCSRSFWRHWRYYLVTAILGIIIPDTNLYFLATRISVDRLSIVTSTAPLFIYPLALFFQQEKFKWIRLISVLLGLAGILWVIIPSVSLFTILMTKWLLLSLLTPVSFAACAVYIEAARPPEMNSVELSIGMLFVATFLFIPILMFYPPSYFMLPTLGIGALMILSIILAAIGFVILFMLLKVAGPVYYSLVDGVVILMGVFWGWVVFNEQLTVTILAAMALILLAIGLMTFTNQRN